MQTFSYFTSVGLARARPHNYISNLIIVTCKLKVELLLYDCYCLVIVVLYKCISVTI